MKGACLDLKRERWGMAKGKRQRLASRILRLATCSGEYMGLPSALNIAFFMRMKLLPHIMARIPSNRIDRRDVLELVSGSVIKRA